jgi:ABC-2 type transport system permease protein
MKGLSKMMWMEAKLFLRDPVSSFFTLIFPLMMLLIFGTIYSNVPADSGSGGKEAIASLIPAFISMVIGITGMMANTMTMATYRENGILRRLRTTPVSPLVIMTTQITVGFVMTALGTLLLVVAGKLIYQVHTDGNAFSILGGFTLGCLSFFGIGFILAGLLPTARTAQIIAMVLVYPMLIFSGAAWPRELMPTAIEKISAFVPLTYVVNLLSGMWSGDSWSMHVTDIAVLVVMLLGGVLVSTKLFRWE